MDTDIENVRLMVVTSERCYANHNQQLELRSSVNFYLNVYQVTRTSVWGGIHPRWFILSKFESVAVQYMTTTKLTYITYHFVCDSSIKESVKVRKFKNECMRYNVARRNNTAHDWY